MNKTIVINATAARTSGALTILKDFMSYVYSANDQYHIFHLLTTTDGIFKSSENVFVHELPVQKWSTRLLWDRSGFQKWCIKNKINPDCVISLQNTCPRLTGALRAVKLLVYYHQQLPLSKYQWKLHKKDERTLFLYAHFYGYFVNRWNRNAEYVVQLPSVKELFCKKFKNISPEKVHVIRPNFPDIDVCSVYTKDIEPGKKVFIYPATPHEYKNHKIVLDAIELLKTEIEKIDNKIKIIFTVDPESKIAKEINERSLNSVVECIGSIPYEELLSYYKCCDGLLFPSKIESFGLPLIEAAMFGVPVIAANLPYAQEVLEGYEGAFFADTDNVQEWKNLIQKLISSDKKYNPLKQKKENSWKEFLEIMNSLLNK